MAIPEDLLKWDVYSGDATVYQLMMPELMGECKSQMTVVGNNLSQTLSTDFLRELVGALDRGVKFYGIFPEGSARTLVGFNRSFRREFGIKEFINAIRRFHGKTMFMRAAPLKGVTPFGIFDQKRVGFSITSPSGGMRLLNLVSDERDVIDEFNALFRHIWDNARDFIGRPNKTSAPGE